MELAAVEAAMDKACSVVLAGYRLDGVVVMQGGHKPQVSHGLHQDLPRPLAWEGQGHVLQGYMEVDSASLFQPLCLCYPDAAVLYL